MEFTFISGATGGLGKAFAENLKAKGAPLFLIGRNQSKLSALVEEMKKDNDQPVMSFVCDLTDENSRRSLIEYIDSEGIKFNRIVNVAGVDIQKPFMDYTEEKLLFQLRVNVEATVSLTYALLKRRAEKTEVLTVSSMSGVSPMPYFAVYSATKALLINLFTSLHYELKGEGVKVTVILPGGIPTRPDIIAQIKEQGLWGKLSAKSPSFVAEKSLRAVRKNKTTYIPGIFNRFLNFLMKLAPKKIVLAFIAKRWKSQTKDAF